MFSARASSNTSVYSSWFTILYVSRALQPSGMFSILSVTKTRVLPSVVLSARHTHSQNPLHGTAGTQTCCDAIATVKSEIFVDLALLVIAFSLSLPSVALRCGVSVDGSWRSIASDYWRIIFVAERVAREAASPEIAHPPLTVTTRSDKGNEVKPL